MSKVAIIILNKSNNKLLFDCLTSIKEKTSFENYHIYIGDTGSTKDELAEISRFLRINFAKNKNASLICFDYYNFAKINNEIVKKHINNEDILFFCNNDIKLIDDCITEGVKMIERNRDTIGTVGFKLLFEDGTIQHAGQLLSINTQNQFQFITHRGLKNNKANYSTRDLVIGNTGGLMGILKDVFVGLNCFNIEYCSCFEDVELNLKCILTGKHNIYIGDKVAWHYESQTRNKQSSKIDNSILDSQRLLIPFVNKNASLIAKTGLVLIA